MFVNTYIQRRRIGANKHFCEQSKQGPEVGGSNIFTHKGVDKLFYTEWGGQTFSVGDDGGDDEVDGEEEEDVSGANIFGSEASKLSAGARISRGP